DFYRVTVNGNSALQVETATPARNSGVFANDFDPMVRIYNAAGVLVAADDNSDPDGRNARASYKVPKGAGGTYYIEVLASPAQSPTTTGEYLLGVKGAVAASTNVARAVGTAPANPAGKKLTAAAARPLLQEAVRLWRLAGVDTTGLGKIDIRVADLGGDTLGRVSGNTIWLDDNAAGWGWFVDKTARNDSEFHKAGNQGEQNRMDLLTVLTHEVGHLLGLDHAAYGIMVDGLEVGVRRKPARVAVQ
ncbi:MAG TPA: matrixin family metalloprotease, partial [Gemmataceae bacterium]|nr:matrixin family metalloprotease [Gemmataceae bacterium]